MSFKKGYTPWNKGLKGYTITPHTEETKKKISESKKGSIPWNKGIKMPKDYIHPFLGKHHSIETKEKIRKTIGNRCLNTSRTHFTSERLKGNKNRLGKIPWNRDKKGLYKHTEEWKKGQSKKSKGENNPSWFGGVSKLPYSFDFNEELKDKIRKRDNYTCQLCKNMTNEEHLIIYDCSLSIHHIDYNKKNSDEKNLITLCKQCHIKTNFNREYWKELFMNLFKQGVENVI